MEASCCNCFARFEAFCVASTWHGRNDSRRSCSARWPPNCNASGTKRLNDWVAISWRALEPLPWDPRWHRFQAILWEGPTGFYRRGHRAVEEVCPGPGTNGVGSRGQIIEDSGHGVASNRLHVGVDRGTDDDDDFYLDDEIDLTEDFEPEFKVMPDGASDAPPEVPDSPAVQALQKSLSLDPGQRKTYEELIDLYEEMEEPRGSGSDHRKLLAAFPDDVEAMRRLIKHHIKRDEPEPVLNYADQIRKLKPLESKIQNEIVWAHLVLARQRAIRGQWDVGRAQFSLAESASQKAFAPYSLLARKAAFEFKAGQSERSRSICSPGERPTCTGGGHLAQPRDRSRPLSIAQSPGRPIQ